MLRSKDGKMTLYVWLADDEWCWSERPVYLEEYQCRFTIDSVDMDEWYGMSERAKSQFIQRQYVEDAE